MKGNRMGLGFLQQRQGFGWLGFILQMLSVERLLAFLIFFPFG